MRQLLYKQTIHAPAVGMVNNHLGQHRSECPTCNDVGSISQHCPRRSFVVSLVCTGRSRILARIKVPWAFASMSWCSMQNRWSRQ
jgi:hypothetical protein